MTRPNVLFLTIDSLRADHLSCYGYPHATSPYMDALAEQGVRCEKMFVSVLPTQPSYTTFYTGQHPIHHGVIGHGGADELSPDSPFLPEIFSAAGYATCAVDSLWGERSWFGRGYEYYINPGLRHQLNLSVACEELNARAIQWLREHAAEPFFLMMHYWDPHSPYTPPKRLQNLFYAGNPVDPDNHSLDNAWHHPVSALVRDSCLRLPEGLVTDANYGVALYDREIRHVDDGIGELLATLEDLGVAENTLVVLVGDHGESMTEHGIFFEHHGLYDATLQIPCIVRWPGRTLENAHFPGLLQSHDIAPTILEAAGLVQPPAMDGRSFWRTMTGEGSNGGREKVVSLEATLQAKWCLRTATHKFILARHPDFYGTPARELYDLREDPGETKNLAEGSPLAAQMEAELEAWIATELKKSGKSVDPVLAQGISMKAVLDTHMLF